MRRLPEYIKDIENAISIKEEHNKDTSILKDHLNRLKAIYPNKKTRIDLYEKQLEEAKTPLTNLYLTKFDVFAIQNYGYVPDRGSRKYQEVLQHYKLSSH